MNTFYLKYEIPKKYTIYILRLVLVIYQVSQ